MVNNNKIIKQDFVKQGKKNRASGAEFERRTRKDLEDKGWIVSKWQNNIEFERDLECIPWSEISPQKLQEMMNSSDYLISGYKDVLHDGKTICPHCHKDNGIKGKMIPAKASRFRLSSTGFPDFIVYTRFCEGYSNDMNIIRRTEFKNIYTTEIIFVECKVGGKLDKIEKEKAKWYLDNGICSKFLIAYKTKEKNRVKVNYKEFDPNGI